jgi:hypothetical protein
MKANGYRLTNRLHFIPLEPDRGGFLPQSLAKRGLYGRDPLIRGPDSRIHAFDTTARHANDQSLPDRTACGVSSAQHSIDPIRSIEAWVWPRGGAIPGAHARGIDGVCRAAPKWNAPATLVALSTALPLMP